MKKVLVAALLAASAMTPAVAQQTLNFTFTDGTATAIGSFDLAHSGNVLTAGNYGNDISNLTVTISNATFGNGTFTSADFYTYAFSTSTALDLTHELFGQDEGFGATFGDQSTSSDFNLFSFNNGAPTGVYYFQLGADQGGANQLRLTSLRLAGAVPEPASWALMLGGFGMIGGALRSHRKVAVSFN